MTDGQDSGRQERGNHIYVSVHKRVSSFVDLSCSLFNTHEEVYLHGLSNAIANTADIAQMLVSTGKCSISKIQTAMLQRAKSARNPPEMVIILKRSPDFKPTPISPPKIEELKIEAA